MEDINCYWLQFDLPPMANHLLLALVFFILFVGGASSNSLVIYILAK